MKQNKLPHIELEQQTDNRNKILLVLQDMNFAMAVSSQLLIPNMFMSIIIEMQLKDL